MFDELKKGLDLGEVDLANYSPLTLAYMGDAVYELVIRTKLVYASNAPVNKLNKRGSDLAKAATQAAMIEAILPDLTEEEEGAYRRGRNAHSYTKAKNATTGDYRKATGFEALIGYLYLANRYERIMELIRLGWERTSVE